MLVTLKTMKFEGIICIIYRFCKKNLELTRFTVLKDFLPVKKQFLWVHERKSMYTLR